MALVVQAAGPLKPNIRLAQALSEFEAILNDDDKKLFRTWREGRPPAVSDVMKLTAEIDRHNGRSMKRRCYGPRLTSILGAVQQFSSAVDVIIGGTQSTIATSIWGVLRMTLQTTVQFGSYFDNLSALFMRIGRFSPRYEQYGAMYPKSSRLQDALFDYFRTVVQVCNKAVLFIRKGTMAQISAAILNPFNSEFGPLELDLSTTAETIREEASLAFQQELTLDKREASSFRAWLLSKASKKTEQARVFRAHQAKFQLLNSCSTYDHEAAWKRARKVGESSRLFDQAAYRDWLQSTVSSVLWVTGILGSGKTVLTASVVQELSIKFPDALVCYLFCSHDDAESLKAKTIIGSLARQLLSSLNPDVFGSIDTTKPGLLGTDEIVAHLLGLLPQNEQIFVIVDGLDECNETELDRLFDCLDRFLKSNHRFHVFCSSRLDIHTKYRTALQPRHHLPLPMHNPEIAQYIDSALEDRLEKGSLCLGDPDIILTIRQALLEGSHGMFLWVVFQLDSICAELTDEDILNALESLPRDLPETFARVLRKLAEKKTTNIATCKKIFAIVAAAHRPLTLYELREAMGVVPGDTEWSPRRLINDICIAVNGCGSLLLIDEEDSAVRFTHHSVKQYLLSDPQDASTRHFHVEGPEADLSIGEICVTYLNYNVFNSTLVKMSNRAILQPQDITASIIERTLPQAAGSKLALKLLKRNAVRDFDVKARIREMAPQEQRQQDYPFLPYAKTFWLFHTRKFETGRQATYKLWLRLLLNSVKIVKLPWGAVPSAEAEGEEEKVLEWALANEHEALVRETTSRIAKSDVVQPVGGLLSMCRENKYLQDVGRTRTARLWEKYLGNETAFSMLVESGLSVDERYYDGNTLLMKAITRQQTHAVKRFLERTDLGVNTKNDSGLTALSIAAMYGDEEMTKLLLACGDIEVNSEDEQGWTALKHAMYHGHHGIADMLLDRGALDLNSQDGSRPTKLHWAAMSLSKEEAAPILGSREFDFNAPDPHGTTILMYAIMKGYTENLRLLLSRGDVDLNLRDECGRTALHFATSGAAHNCLLSLLERGDVDTEIRDIDGRTPLDIAIESKNMEAIRLLKDRGPEVT
ncbi:hypothetical protein AYL99_08489 [Fonsecaea erecta]|uniref:Uncharacterized protein n=1 Tax=Fonsecaea erecta TaxID=1367422 RepID=A0A178ZE64_9EURO|nr:hypothetical protein AYL99_08489 [Fonsecaea erecta]OAP57751.1 hypothetical protein AYL99_08489 [Fonsecaea erecta]